MKNLFSSLIVGEVKQIPISMTESIVLRTAIEKQPISAQTYKDIIFDTDGMKQYISEHPIIKSVIVE
jgi:hypothetical protein